MQLLQTACSLLEPGGWIAVKAPCGPAQYRKETLRAMLRPSYRATLADNLVHINHFTPGSLRRALAECGFKEIRVMPGAPEIPPPYVGEPLSHRLAIRMRTPLHALLKAIPFAPDFPLCMHLQACARRAS